MNQSERQTVEAALQKGKSQLKKAGAGEYQLDAVLLLMQATGFSKIGLLIHDKEFLTEAQQRQYELLLKRREQGEPLQYITGQCEFMALPFLVQSGVLIPRPETELLVEEILNRYQEENPFLALEIGVGSGCIAVSLAAYRKKAKILAIDVSDTAFIVAKQNAEKNDTEKQIAFFHSDIYQNIPEAFFSSLDFIVSNPPYISQKEIKTLMREVRDFEPELALDGGEDGLSFYRKIVKEAMVYLKAGGMLFLEIGADQGSSVSGFLKEAGFCEIQVKKDLAGLDRIVIGKKNE